ncbi:MAG: mechanosensitive ion channel [Campylobacterales bacterium]|nr:mechanosensitive ion channel [Campylobacterales bacterium]
MIENPVDVTKYTDMAIMYISEYGLKIIAAILIFVIGKWAITKIAHFTKMLMQRAHIDQTLVEFAHSIVYFVLLIMVVLASLNTLGINTSSFLAIFGAASLAVGLAIKDSLSNIGAAVIIIIFRPFKIGDTIETGGANGTVKEINLFSTIIEPADKSTIIIPNSSIIGKNITNFSNRKERRIDLIFSISYDSNLKLAKDTLMNIITSDARVLIEPAPLVAVNELTSRSVNLAFKVWVLADNYGTVYFDMLEKVKLAFDEKGISIPVIDGHTN